MPRGSSEEHNTAAPPGGRGRQQHLRQRLLATRTLRQRSTLLYCRRLASVSESGKVKLGYIIVRSKA